MPLPAKRRVSPPSSLRLFHNRSLHSSIRNFLLLRNSAAMPKLVLEMRTGKAALGGARRVPQGGYRAEKPPA